MPYGDPILRELKAEEPGRRERADVWGLDGTGHWEVVGKRKRFIN